MRFYIVAICSIILDQVTKSLILNSFSKLPSGYSKNIIDDFLYFTFVKNTGGAFGLKIILSPWLVFISTLFVFIFLTYYVMYKKNKAPIFMYGLGFILGGAIGNLADRFRYGYVVDFIDLRFWPVFNIADITITAGVGMVIYYLLFCSDEIIDKKTTSKEIEVDEPVES